MFTKFKLLIESEAFRTLGDREFRLAIYMAKDAAEGNGYVDRADLGVARKLVKRRVMGHDKDGFFFWGLRSQHRLIEQKRRHRARKAQREE